MKRFFILLSVVAFAQSLVTTDEMRKSCKIKENPADGNLRLFLDGEPINDHRVNCYMKCVFINNEVFSEDGVVNVENFMINLDQNYGVQGEIRDLLQGIIVKCAKDVQTVQDLCDKAYMLYRCNYDSLRMEIVRRKQLEHNSNNQ